MKQYVVQLGAAPVLEDLLARKRALLAEIVSAGDIRQPVQFQEGLSMEALPPAVAAVVVEVARFLGDELRSWWLFVADHRYEELRGGGYSIAFEGGWFHWPTEFTGAVAAGRYGAVGVQLEAFNGCTLAVYPV